MVEKGAGGVRLFLYLIIFISIFLFALNTQADIPSKLIKIRIYEGEAMFVMFPNGVQHKIEIEVIELYPDKPLRVLLTIDNETDGALEKYDVFFLPEENAIRIGTIFPGINAGSAEIIVRARKIRIEKNDFNSTFPKKTPIKPFLY